MSVFLDVCNSFVRTFAMCVFLHLFSLCVLSLFMYVLCVISVVTIISFVV